VVGYQISPIILRIALKGAFTYIFFLNKEKLIAALTMTMIRIRISMIMPAGSPYIVLKISIVNVSIVFLANSHLTQLHCHS